ncbi:MAG: DNA polymerase IV, partial [Atopobiaceae bacterium]|nr:DNA polymerase IV [Atopobiaceae bacterium]
MDGFADIASWTGPAIGLLDLDAFFASVELLDDPSLKGKPVIIGYPGPRGVVSIASYEARKYGVHSAMPSIQAMRLCPDAIWIHGRHERYAEVSRQVMAIVFEETPLVEQVSVDEAFFDVTPGRFSSENPVDICRRIQQRVLALGVSCSIGLGCNKTVAKIASDMDKPRGFTVVWPGREKEFLAPLPVRAMSGIGSSTESALHAMGIHTLGELARADAETIANRFGVHGDRMRLRAAGIERSRVVSPDQAEPAKSVSTEHTFGTDLTTADELDAAIDFVSERVGRRLRRKGLAGDTVTLKLKFDGIHSRTARTQLGFPTDEPAIFSPVAKKLLSTLWREGIGVRLVGVAISGFDGDAQPVQTTLFDDPEDAARSEADEERKRRLSKATDELRARFGNDALSYG